MINSKGQLGKIITTIPVMIVIVFIIAIYLVLAGFAFKVRGENIPGFIESVGSSDVLLLDEISVDNKNILILDGFIKDKLYEDEIKILSEKIRARGFNNLEEENAAKERLADISKYSRGLREGIRKGLEQNNLNNYNGEKQCFIAFFEYGLPALSNWRSARDIYLVMENGNSDKGDINELEGYYDSGLLSLVKVPIKFYNSEITFIVQGYYGRCYSNNELNEMINKRRSS